MAFTWRFILDERKLRNFSMESGNIATVDAYGIYLRMALVMLLYIGVGFVVACFDSNGIAKAFVRGTSKERVSTLFYSLSCVFKARLT